MVPKIIATNVSKIFRRRHDSLTAIDNFSLEVKEGEFFCIVGPSGCGKSTFLRILDGIYPQTSGEVVINHAGVASNRPLTAMVFQESALFPWKNVLQNAAFGLKMRGVPRREREDITRRCIEKVGLRQFIFNYPHELSGGMKQRVNIARALANDPGILLMDEPFANLDAQTRVILQEETLRIWEEDRKTVVYVTHSIEEAILLGDRVLVMTARPGRNKGIFNIEFERPRSLEVKKLPAFSDLEFAIWDMIKEEVTQSMGANA